jgi:di/tricarboxylate transporter
LVTEKEVCLFKNHHLKKVANMPPELTFTSDMLIVLAALGLAILFFVFEWVRVDVVGLMMMVVLPLSGVIAPEEAIAGLGSNAVVSIIAVIIIGAGLDKSGVMNIISRQIVKLAGNSQTRIMAFLSAAVAVISSFMQNIGAVSLFMPAASRISRRLNIPVSKILMPMGFCAIIGGCLTLVGSSPLILLNDLMASWYQNNPEAMDVNQLEPFGLFSVTPIGIALVAAGLIYFILLGRFILPPAPAMPKDICMSSYLDDIYGQQVGLIYELTVPKNFQTKTLKELHLRPRYHATVDCIAKKQLRRKILAPTYSDTIEGGDVVAVITTKEHVQQLANDLGWEVKPELDVFREDLAPDNAGIIEAIVTPHSELAGKTMREIHFRKRYQVNPLAIFRDNKVLLEFISSIKLRHGDAILFQGQWAKFPLLHEKLDLVFTEELRGVITRPEKAGYAVFSLAIALVLALLFHVKLSIALLTGAIGMILTRVLAIDEAYKSVDWMTIFLLGGLIPLGVAFEKTGTAQYIAMSMISAMGKVTPFMLMVLIGLLSSFFTLVASNVGATVLLVPLAMNLAVQIGADPRMAALVVAVATSNTFMLPTHQVNALIMRPGGYKTMDYIRAGTGMTALFIVVVLTVLYFGYGI